MTEENFKNSSRIFSRWLLRRKNSSGLRRIAPLEVVLATDPGLVRLENQDHIAALRGVDLNGVSYSVVALADGIGGMKDGMLCSAKVIAVFFSKIIEISRDRNNYPPDQWLRVSALEANSRILEDYAGKGGATLVAVLRVGNKRPYWLSIGDSRVYSWSRQYVSQISTDDTIAGQLGKQEEVDNEQKKLLQFIGFDGCLDVHIGSLSTEENVNIILTSDGVHYLSSQQGWFERVVVNSGDPGTCVRRLIDLSKWCGGPDNASISIISSLNPVEPRSELDRDLVEVWDPFGELQVFVSARGVEGLGFSPEREGGDVEAHVRTPNSGEEGEEGGEKKKSPRKRLRSSKNNLKKSLPIQESERVAALLVELDSDDERG